MKIYTSVEQLIGGTPLLELCRTEQALELGARLLVKLEKCSPGGSVKDRIALQMIHDAEEQGLLKAGATIIEATSGSTGIGLACIGAARGYRIIIVMPDSMSVERQRLMRAYGAEVVLTPGAEGMAGSVRKAEELARTIPGSFIPAQFDNPSNPAAHLATTGPEIWEDTGGAVDIFVAGVGTGGTITGAGRYLKSKSPASGWLRWSRRLRPCSPGERRGPIPCRASGPISCPPSWTRRCTTACSPSAAGRPMPPAATPPAGRAFWWASPPARPSMPPWSWPNGRKTQARPSWPCCPIPVSGTCPPRALSGSKGKGAAAERPEKKEKHPHGGAFLFGAGAAHVG